MDKTYTDGLNDAWELMKKIIEMYSEDTEGAFGIFFTPINEASKNLLLCLMKEFTPQEALAKLKAYEKEIKVGDVVEDIHTGKLYVVTMLSGNICYVLFSDGSAGTVSRNELKKTNKHIDITSVLEQLRGE